MQDLKPEALCFANVANDPDCALYWLDQLTDHLEHIGEDGRSEIVRRMFELQGVDMNDCPKPNVGEYYLISLLAIRKRLSDASPPVR